jgi:hypothetical protein
MGAPASAIFAEIFLKSIEYSTIYHIVLKHQIIDYYRYVDHILIIFNDQHMSIILYTAI